MGLLHRDCGWWSVVGAGEGNGKLKTELKSMGGVERLGRATMCRFRHIRRCWTGWLKGDLRNDETTMPSAIETTISLRSLFRNAGNQIAEGRDAASISCRRSSIATVRKDDVGAGQGLWAAWGNAT